MCDDFNGAAVDTSKWGMYDGTGHGGNGRRLPGQATVANGYLTLSGTANGDTAGMAVTSGQQYGRWEARMKAPVGCDCYHPVLLLWPDAEDWPQGGEIDYAEQSSGSRQSIDFFLHYSASNQQTSASKNIDVTQWHNYAVEWTATHVKGYIDGQEWFSDTNASHIPPRAMHQSIQLDWFPGGGGTGSMDVDWMHVYKQG
jgi:licheninase